MSMESRKIRLKLYTILRDYTGSGEIEVECREGDTLKSLLNRASARHPGLSKALDVISWSVYGLTGEGLRVELDSTVECDGEIHLIPPPSGGGTMIEARLLDSGTNVDITSLIVKAASTSKRVGAVAVFTGVVKGFVEGAHVSKLYYEAADRLVAEKVIRSILEEESKKHGLTAAIVYHYTGTRMPGEVTIIAVVAGPSRTNVYLGLSSIVDRVKSEAPIWKIEYRVGGEKLYILGDRIVKSEEDSLVQGRKSEVA